MKAPFGLLLYNFDSNELQIMHFQVTKLHIFLGKGALPLATPTCGQISSTEGIVYQFKSGECVFKCVAFLRFESTFWIMILWYKLREFGLKKYAFSGHKIQNFLGQSGSAPLQPACSHIIKSGDWPFKKIAFL